MFGMAFHIYIYTNNIKLHRHCKKRRSKILRTLMADSLGVFARATRDLYGVFTSGVLTTIQITTSVGQNLADGPEFSREFWSRPEEE